MKDMKSRRKLPCFFFSLFIDSQGSTNSSFSIHFSHDHMYPKTLLSQDLQCQDPKENLLKNLNADFLTHCCHNIDFWSIICFYQPIVRSTSKIFVPQFSFGVYPNIFHFDRTIGLQELYCTFSINVP